MPLLHAAVRIVCTESTMTRHGKDGMLRIESTCEEENREKNEMLKKEILVKKREKLKVGRK